MKKKNFVEKMTNDTTTSWENETRLEFPNFHQLQFTFVDGSAAVIVPHSITYSAIFNDDIVRFEMGTLLKKWSSTARVHSLLSSPRRCKVYRSESGSLHRHTLMHRSRGLRKDPAWDASRESPGTDCSAIYKESPVQE